MKPINIIIAGGIIFLIAFSYFMFRSTGQHEASHRHEPRATVETNLTPKRPKTGLGDAGEGASQPRERMEPEGIMVDVGDIKLGQQQTGESGLGLQGEGRGDVQQDEGSGVTSLEQLKGTVKRAEDIQKEFDNLKNGGNCQYSDRWQRKLDWLKGQLDRSVEFWQKKGANPRKESPTATRIEGELERLRTQMNKDCQPKPEEK